MLIANSRGRAEALFLGSSSPLDHGCDSGGETTAGP